MAMWRDKNFLANQHHFTKKFIALNVLFYFPLLIGIEEHLWKLRQEPLGLLKCPMEFYSSKVST